MKLRSRFDAFRHRWILTPEEKRVVVFVLLAFLLGVTTKHYRDMHPPLPRKIDKKYSRASTPSPSPKRAKKSRTKTNIAPVAPGEMQAQPGKG